LDNKGIVIIDGTDVQLFAGTGDVESIPVTIIAGSGVLAAGTVLGRLTAAPYKYAPYDDTKQDGTEVARAILVENIDATLADVNTSGYVDGTFNRAALTGIDTLGEFDLQDRGIFVKDIY
jgi:hypothetical protein